MNMEVPGKTKRGRPRKRWKDTIKEDMLEKNVQVDDTRPGRPVSRNWSRGGGGHFS